MSIPSNASSFPKSTVSPNVGDESLAPVQAGQQAGTTPHDTRHAPTHSATPHESTTVPSSIPRDTPQSDVAEVVTERPRGVDEGGEKVGFMEKAKGFAQVFNGKVHGDEKKVLAGEAELRGVEGVRKADV